jgi:hypothetical protein
MPFSAPSPCRSVSFNLSQRTSYIYYYKILALSRFMFNYPQMQTNSLSQCLNEELSAISQKLGALTSNCIQNGNSAELTAVQALQSEVVKSAKNMRQVLQEWELIKQRIASPLTITATEPTDATAGEPTAEEMTTSERRARQGLQATVHWNLLGVDLPDSVIKNNNAKDAFLATLKVLSVTLPVETLNKINHLRVGRSVVISDNPQVDFPMRNEKPRGTTQIGDTTMFVLTDTSTANKVEYLDAISEALTNGQRSIESLPFDRE